MKTKYLPLLLLTYANSPYAADLAVILSSSHSKVAINNTINYTGSVVNKGTDTASNVRLVFYMAPRNINIGNLPQNCTNNNSKITCSLGNLEPGSSSARMISVTYSKVGGAIVSVNALSDSADSYYDDNFKRMVTNATAATNITNAPFVPSVVGAKATPTSVVQGNSVTFTANLDAPLPAGYSVKLNYDGNTYTLNASAPTGYTSTQTLNNVGLKTFRVGVYNSAGNLQGSDMTGTLQVTLGNSAPTLALISGANTASTGTAYTLQLQANDVDGNLGSIQTNWGDGSADSQTASAGSTLTFTHTYSSEGSYTINAKAYDSAGASSSAVTKTVSVTKPVSSSSSTGKLNDTGITLCADATSNSKTCPVSDYPSQDAQYGRDATHNDDSDGHAGFSFTKISSSGSELSASANSWNCVKDNVTGLIWEVKTTDGGLHDWNNTYTWYEPDRTKNGGEAGTPKGGSCKGSDCDTNAYVKAVNAAGWCGYKDWRLPTKQELRSIVNYGTYSPAIDGDYFPNTSSDWYWSSSSDAYGSNYAWYVVFVNGYTDGDVKFNNFYVRLVR
jgi:hypothetical protein